MLLPGDDGRPLSEIYEEIYQSIIRATTKELKKLPAFRCFPSRKITTGDVITELNGARDYLRRRMAETDMMIYLPEESSSEGLNQGGAGGRS